VNVVSAVKVSIHGIPLDHNGNYIASLVLIAISFLFFLLFSNILKMIIPSNLSTVTIFGVCLLLLAVAIILHGAVHCLFSANKVFANSQ
ncbi:hypothetical protein PFISCL1PPCAC_24567, partial [Pristionchus fissidentatus]